MENDRETLFNRLRHLLDRHGIEEYADALMDTLDINGVLDGWPENPDDYEDEDDR